MRGWKMKITVIKMWRRMGADPPRYEPVTSNRYVNEDDEIEIAPFFSIEYIVVVREPFRPCWLTNSCIAFIELCVVVLASIGGDTA